MGRLPSEARGDSLPRRGATPFRGEAFSKGGAGSPQAALCPESPWSATAEDADATRGGGHSETAAIAPKATSFVPAACAHCRKRVRLGHWALPPCATPASLRQTIILNQMAWTPPTRHRHQCATVGVRCRSNSTERGCPIHGVDERGHVTVTPDKPGEYEFTCQMRMYRGTLMAR